MIRYGRNRGRVGNVREGSWFCGVECGGGWWWVGWVVSLSFEFVGVEMRI